MKTTPPHHTAALVLLASLASITFFACDTGGPVVPGFASGGIQGSICPPGTETDGSCGDPDCGVGCLATTSCASGETCPAGTVCGTLETEKWCVPKTCDLGCAETEKCNEFDFDKPVCVTK